MSQDSVTFRDWLRRHDIAEEEAEVRLEEPRRLRHRLDAARSGERLLN